MLDLNKLKQTIEASEGRVHHAYQDHLGYWTIGVGMLIDKNQGGHMPDEVIDYWLDLILRQCFDSLDANISWWRGLPDGVQEALVEMRYQLGWPRLSGFKKMLTALEAKDYATAADEALDSRWAKQTPERAKRVAEQIRKGF